MKPASTLEVAAPTGAARTKTPEAARTAPIWTRDPWSYLFSLKVGLVLLAVLTVASIAGTLIPELERAQAVVYYTWWFKLLLVALAVNMSCATYKTVVTKTIPLSRPRYFSQLNFYKASKPSRMVAFTGSVSDAAAAFRARGFKVSVEGACGYARRGMIGRWGSCISHVGLVVVLLGGFAASWVAKEAIVKIPEGASTDKMWMRTDPPTEMPLGFVLSVEDFDTEFFPRTQMPSKFVSTISAFELSGEKTFAGIVEVNNSPTIHGWTLHQTSYEELKGAPRYLVAVSEGEGSVETVVELSPGQRRALSGFPGREFQLSAGAGLKWRVYEGEKVLAEGSFAGGGAGMKLRADQFEPDFVLGPDRKATSRSKEYNNPALKVTLIDGDGNTVGTQWLFDREDMKSFSHTKLDDFAVELESAHEENGATHLHVKVSDSDSGVVLGSFSMVVGQTIDLGGEQQGDSAPSTTPTGWQARVLKSVPAYATVLTATRNPLIPFIYAGCGLMMVGLILGFFVRRREVWFQVDEKSGQLRVAAAYRHPSDEFDPAARAAIDSLTTA